MAAMAARVVAWLGGTSRRWLVVLDDLRDAADLEGLWPMGAAGRVLITAADPQRAQAALLDRAAQAAADALTRCGTFMILASFGRYLPRTGHDHETGPRPGATP